MNAIEWYNYIALRNGGYKVNVPYDVVGLSAEDVFEAEVKRLIEGKTVLDAGCGHSEFTLRMAQYAKSIFGYDFAGEMIKLAERLRTENGIENASFLETRWGAPLSFPDEYFDVLYSRRGPCSIVDQHRLLKPGGLIIGIHIYPIADGEITDRIAQTGAYADITRDIYQEAVLYFDTEREYAEYLSSMHMNPDYTLPENRAAFDEILAKSQIDGRIGFRESKQIWRAKKR